MTKPKLLHQTPRTRVIYRLTVHTLPDRLETEFTPPDTGVRQTVGLVNQGPRASTAEYVLLPDRPRSFATPARRFLRASVGRFSGDEYT